MFEALFGAEMPLAIRFFLAFLIVLGLIGVAFWAIGRFGVGARFRSAGVRGRQPRLAIIDHAHVDSRRRLILVRRDNVEHLVMVGGPTDIVVEANIVRAAAAREAPPPRVSVAAESLPRAVPLAEDGSWPLQPEPGTSPRHAPRLAAASDEPAASESNKRQPPPLSGLLDEIAARPVPPRNRAGAARQSSTVPKLPETRAEPRMPSISTPSGDAVASADQTLAEMAHRLEAALRKPKPAPDAREVRVPPPVSLAEAMALQAKPDNPLHSGPPPLPPTPAVDGDSEPKPERAEGKATQGKALYDSLEQEMASLLGRPAGKI